MESRKQLMVLFILIVVFIILGDNVDNTVQEKSSVFSLNRMRWLPSARACGQ